MGIKLGKLQIDMLYALNSGGMGHVRGLWHRRCGWEWTGPARTLRILESLRIKGMVALDQELSKASSTLPDETYSLTPEGEAMIVVLRANKWKAA